MIDNDDRLINDLKAEQTNRNDKNSRSSWNNTLVNDNGLCQDEGNDNKENISHVES